MKQRPRGRIANGFQYYVMGIGAHRWRTWGEWGWLFIRAELIRPDFQRTAMVRLSPARQVPMDGMSRYPRYEDIDVGSRIQRSRTTRMQKFSSTEADQPLLLAMPESRIEMARRELSPRGPVIIPSVPVSSDFFVYHSHNILSNQRVSRLTGHLQVYSDRLPSIAPLPCR